MTGPRKVWLGVWNSLAMGRVARGAVLYNWGAGGIRLHDGSNEEG
jgi:hypothetical protein